jgi:hypothetical protein
MTELPPASSLLQPAPFDQGRHASLLRRALVIGLFTVFGFVLIAIVIVLVIVITHGGGIHMVE